MAIDISEFKARNAEAQRINSEIQRMAGAIEENKKQFRQLCEAYEKTYGEHVDEQNLAEVLARVSTDVEKQAIMQAELIEKAKQGIVIHKDEASAQTGVSSGVGIQPSAQVGAQASTQPTNSDPTQGTIPVQASSQGTIPVQPSAQASTQPSAQPISSAAQQPFVAPVQPAPVPMSASTLSQAALQQSNNGVTHKMPSEAPANPTPIQPTVGIAGWNNNAGAGLDFNKILGGNFGGV